jgi:hypothetical protein
MQTAYRRFNQGKSVYKIQEEDADVINHFIEVNKKMPSSYNIHETFSYEQLLDLLGKHDGFLISWKHEMGEHAQVLIQVRTPNCVVFIKTGHTSYVEPSGLKLTEEQRSAYLTPKGILSIETLEIYYDLEFGRPTDLINEILNIKIVDNEQINKIHLICQDPDIGFYTKGLPIGGDMDFDLALHYGDDMPDFHEKQIKRLKSGSKGIILFYGDPGTGKSTYIKRLCRDLFKVDKKILYLPNNMVDNIGTPIFNNFLLDWAEDNQNDTRKGILIIIEDGERILLKRDENPYGADGVSNILNSTDGIMNDFINIQILATFNTSIDRIDEAILRKKRALAIRQFKKLSVEDSQRLIDHLKIENKVDSEMALADIYAMLDDDDEVLFRDVKPKNKKQQIGFGKK